MHLAVLAFALNLESRVKTYGAYAGLAAIVGLAVLSVLYFAQAREVKRLRAWAGRGPERAAEDAARVGADAQKRVVAEPIAKPEPETVAAQSTPAGPGVGPVTAAAATGAATATTGGNGAEEEAKPDEATPASDGEVSGDASRPDAPAATPAANGAPATAETTDDAAKDKAAAENKRQTSVAMAPVPASARPRASATPTPARTPRTPSRGNGDGSDDGDGGSRRTWWIAGGVIGVLIIVGVVIAIASSGGSSTPARHAATASTPTPSVVTETKTHKVTGPAAPPRASIIVGVLNGTNTTGLARRVGQQLAGAGFNVPSAGIQTAADQTHAATIVAYAHGDERSGLAVAKTLGLGSDALTEMDRDTAVQAGGDKTVIVTVGADLNR